MVILELIRASAPDFGRVALIRLRTDLCLHSCLVIHNNFVNRIASAGDGSLKFLTYQL